MTAQRHPGWTLNRITESHADDWAQPLRGFAERAFRRYDQRRAFADNRRARLRFKRARRVLFRSLGRKVATKTTLAVEVGA